MANALLPPRPHGLGTSAAALAETGRPARAVAALYCPSAVRTDPQLAAQVQDGLDQWAQSLGAAPDAVGGLGRLAVLTHPDTDDPARLAVAAKLLAAGQLIETGTLPTTSTSTSSTDTEAAASASAAALKEVYDACDTPNPAPAVTPANTPADPAEQSGARGPVTPGSSAPPALLTSALSAFSALPASPYQVDRVSREFGALAAAPRGSGPDTPWQHLAAGHVNAFSPALAGLDALDGYELSPSAAADPELRRIVQLAALAAALLRDLARPSPVGLTAAIGRAEGLGTAAAARRAAAVHDDAMHALHQHATALAGDTPKTPTRRYLSGLWTWLGGHRSWHAEP